MLSLPRSSYYYEPLTESEENLALMRRMDELYLDYPFYGIRRMWANLKSEFKNLNIKRIRRLMKQMGIEAIYQKPNLSKAAEGHKVYPYLLDKERISKANQVWATDITYIPMERGFLYLVAVIDWYSRFILAWELSNSLSVDFCVNCLQKSLEKWGKPCIFNTDQGSQFTSNEFTQLLLNKQVKISMDSKGRALDNIMIERFWRSLKYECVYIHSFENGKSLYQGLEKYIYYYNYHRKHQSLGYQCPSDVYLNVQL